LGRKEFVPAQEPSEYFEEWVAQARSSDRLLVVLDPERYLDLDDELPVGSRTWWVYHYAENDLAFRAAYSNRPADPNFCHIVWVTPSPFRRTGPSRLDLSFIPDVLRRADRILDLSLAGLLRDLVHGEVFPETGLQEYGHILSRDLQTLLAGHRELRREIGQRQPLDIHHVRALALHCLRSDTPLSDLLFTQTNDRDVLSHYLRLIWSARFEGQALSLLQEHVAQSYPAPTGVLPEKLLPWFQSPPNELALLVYTYRALKDFHVPNPVNQLRGLGLLSTDPVPLAPYLDMALDLWEGAEVRTEIIRHAEAMLETESLADIVSLLPMPDIPAVSQALRRETAPALTFGLAERFLSVALNEGMLDDIRMDQLPPEAALTDVETIYSERAQAALLAIHEVAFVLEGLRRPFKPFPDLAKLADWYVENGIYRLELARALAEEHVKQLASASLRQKLQGYLDQLLRRIWDYLDAVDANLTSLIAQGYDAFLDHPRLSVRVLHDTIPKPRFHPTQKRCVWILVFDGMRWDSWKEVALPALTKYFEIVDEGKAYLSLLPSFTSVARTGLLAGGAPPTWRAANGRHTANEAVLVARLFDLDPAERDRQLRIEVSSETDIVQRRLGGDFDRRPINILIYNISDDWIHKFQGGLDAVNKIIAEQMQTVVSDLQRHVREDDLIVATSDHGFVELDPDASIPVSDRELRDQGMEAPPGEHIFYRYLVNLKHPSGLQVPFYGDTFYTLAQGHAWFQREKGRPSRYSHGGISMSEMVVPGMTMRRIVEPCVKLALSGLPRHIEALEKEPQTVSVALINSGNRATEYTIIFVTNTELEGETFRGTLRPHETRELSYTFTSVYSPRVTDRLTVQITYIDVDGYEKRLPTLSTSITTEPRKDVVEIDFGGLDHLDEL
jgi:hypothetical protein